MAKLIYRTAHDDAPLSAAHSPDAASAAEAPEAHTGDTLVGRTITVNRPRHELYAFWRNFDNLSRFMENVHSVSMDGKLRSHWVVLGPAGRSVEWDAEIVAEVANERIAWASLEPSAVRSSGSVEFRDSPNGRGTLVKVTFAYAPAGGGVGKAIASLFGKNPENRARQDLRRFKQLMETGEISTAMPRDSSTSGNRASL